MIRNQVDIFIPLKPSWVPSTEKATGSCSESLRSPQLGIERGASNSALETGYEKPQRGRLCEEFHALPAIVVSPSALSEEGIIARRIPHANGLCD